MSNVWKVVLLLVMIAGAAAFIKVRHIQGDVYEKNPRYIDPAAKVTKDGAQ